MVNEIKRDDELLAMIIPADYQADGIEFFTPSSFSQQLAYMHHPGGKLIEPHLHNPVRRNITYTQEVLLIRKGKLRVDFYSNEQEYIESHILQTGDVILLVSGGHGFEVLEEVEGRGDTAVRGGELVAGKEIVIEREVARGGDANGAAQGLQDTPGRVAAEIARHLR